MASQSWSYRVFFFFNCVILVSLSLLCILPFIHILAVSLSGNGPTQANEVGLWPVEFTTRPYEHVLSTGQFTRAFGVSVRRVLLGVAVQLILIILLAYPLSKEARNFRGRNVYTWIVVFTMLFNGGIIPMYILMKQLGLFDSVWALVFGGGWGAVPVFLTVLMLNFFRQLPKELDEAATTDGAGEWMKMLRVYLPLSLPSLMTVTMFLIVYHWNSWFDGLIYMTDTKNYPLQTYLRVEINRINNPPQNMDESVVERKVSQRAAVAAQLVIAMLPITAVYPFIQQYFKEGIVLGSVKG